MKRLMTLLATSCMLVVTACSGSIPAPPGAPSSASVPASASASASAPAACSYTATGDAVKQVNPPSATPPSGKLAYLLRLNDDDLALTLDADHAPCTVNSFVSLASQGFFDGSACHRLVDSSGLYVLQCGDPSGTGSGGPGYQFDDELTGAETYAAGTLAMANAGPGTNGSQFFIVYADSQLSPNYTVFGSVDAKAVKVLAELAAGGQDNSFGSAGGGKPNSPAVITSIKPA